MTEASPSPEHKISVKMPNTSPIFAKLSLAISLLAIGASLYSIHYNQRSDIRLGMQQEQLHSSLQTLAQTQTTLGSELNTLKQNMVNLVGQTNTAPPNPSAEAIKDTWYRDEALQALQLATEQLQKNSDPSLAELLVSKSIGLLKASRQANEQSIADDLERAALEFQTQYRSNLTKIMHNLDTLQNQSLELVIKEPRFTPGNTTPAVPATDSPKLWRDKLKDSLNLLEKVIVVRKQDDIVNPLLLPIYQKIVLESIRINLQEAQWALLSRNMVLYAQSLTQVSHELEHYTAADAPINQDFAVLLNELKQADGQPTIALFAAAVSTALQKLEQASATGNNNALAEDSAQ